MRRFAVICAVIGISLAACAMALAQNGTRQRDYAPSIMYSDESEEQIPDPSTGEELPYPELEVTDEAGMPESYGDEAPCYDNGGCDPCGYGPACGLGSCCLGEPWTVRDALTPCSAVNYGGWIQAGYHSQQTGLSEDPGDLADMNDVPHHLNLHQGWLFVEKVAEADCCGPDWGFRFDVLYGTDAQKAQSFGNENNTWDVSLDHGYYGWAMPQAYGEVAFGDWTVIGGHFLSIIGYETVPSPLNFFYSRSLTHFNSEPWVHTGVLTRYEGIDCLTMYGGWTLGWDTGFDQYGGGSNFLGGFTAELSDDVTATYTTTLGNFGWRSADQNGQSHSMILELALTDCLDYVVQGDYVHTDGAFDEPDFEGQDVGIVQYVFYTLNDCLVLGSRVEWWKSNQVTGFNDSFNEITGGVNIKPLANLVIRPEVRYDWTNESAGADTLDYNQTIFGIDAIVTF